MASKKEYNLGFIIGAQLKSSFPAAFKSVEKQILSAQKAVKNCGTAWKDFGAQAGKLALGVAGVATAVGAAVWKTTDSVASAGAEIYDTSQRLRMTAEEFQGLRYAFEQSGVSADEFTGMVERMNATLAKAAKDDKSAAKLAKFGLSAEKLAKMTPDQAIRRLSDYMRAIEDPSERSRLALELFGKSGAAMEAAMLQGGDALQELSAEFQRTGNMISNETAEQADKYDEMKKHLTETVNGIKVQLFSKLIPIFSDAFGDISARLQGVNWAEWGDKISGWVSEAVPKIQEIAARIGDFVGKIWDGIQAVKDFVGGWGNLAKLGGFLAALPTIISGVQALISTFKMFKAGLDIVTKLFPALGGGGLTALLPLLPVIAAIAAAAFIIYKNWDKLKPLFEKVMAKLKETWDKVWPSIQAALGKLEPLIGTIGDAIGKLIEFMMPKIEWAIEFIGVVIENVMNLLGPLFDFVGSLVTFFVDLFSGNWSKLGEDIAAIWESVKTVFSSVFDAIINIASKWIEGLLIKFEPLTKFFGDIGDKIASIFGGKKTMTVDVQTTGADIPGHAEGGIFTRPHIASFAENAPRVPEAAIPVEHTAHTRGLLDQTARLAGFTQNANTVNEGFSVTVPVTVKVEGNADADTVNRLKGAANDISARVRTIVRSELAEIARQKARLAF